MRRHQIYLSLVIFYLVITVAVQVVNLPEKDIMKINNVRIADSETPKPVITWLHKKQNKEVGVVKEKVNKYQFIKSAGGTTYTVVEVECTNTTPLNKDYDLYQSRLILDNGETIKVSPNQSVELEQEFKANYTQIGNLAFINADKNIKAIKFPDGSVCGL